MKLHKNLILAGLSSVMMFACSPESPKLQVKEVFREDQVSEKPKDYEVFTPKVDILFVIDSSGSMEDEQNKLSQNAREFANAISKVGFLDFHIGVITTDMQYDHCATECGRLKGRDVYYTKSTPNFVRELSNTLMVGTRGSGTEVMFAPVQAALSPPLVNGENAGFYRQDAYLAVIFLTDAGEQSRISPTDFYNSLVTLKGDARKVLSYGVIRKYLERYVCTASAEDSQITRILEDFLEMTINGGKAQPNVLSLCSADYGAQLAEFAKDIVMRSSGKVKLASLPLDGTIVVRYGTQVIPNSLTSGWTYERSSNSIFLSDGIIWEDQGAGVGLTVDYKSMDTAR
ncbi:hypothetical protein D3C72_1134400 [compost metagenome]